MAILVCCIHNFKYSRGHRHVGRLTHQRYSDQICFSTVDILVVVWPVTLLTHHGLVKFVLESSLGSDTHHDDLFWTDDFKQD